MENRYSEIKTDYTDDLNLTMIDTYRTENEMEEGKIAACVCRDTGKVIFFNPQDRLDPQVREAIYEVLVEIRDNNEVIDKKFVQMYLENSLKEFGKSK